MVPSGSYRGLSKAFRLNVTVFSLSPRGARGAMPRNLPERVVAPTALVELLEGGALIDAPKDELQQGDKLRLEIETEGFPDEIRMAVTGVVARVTIDPQKTEADTIEARLDKVDPRIWLALRAGLEGRQDEVEKVFLAMKGQG